MPLLFPVVELETTEDNETELTFCSKFEKGWHSCRFACTFTYSEEGEYRQSHWIVCNDESGLISRMYFDT
ncbi:MAG: hypothetical protein LBH00_11035, partial [Planctomycetaceae bacterium]|nr:hypothetical protein [Planctomycetaceae bacterium]